MTLAQVQKEIFEKRALAGKEHFAMPVMTDKRFARSVMRSGRKTVSSRRWSKRQR